MSFVYVDDMKKIVSIIFYNDKERELGISKLKEEDVCSLGYDKDSKFPPILFMPDGSDDSARRCAGISDFFGVCYLKLFGDRCVSSVEEQRQLLDFCKNELAILELL